MAKAMKKYASTLALVPKDLVEAAVAVAAEANPAISSNAQLAQWGVDLAELTTVAAKNRLTADQIGGVVAVRAEFQASIPYAAKLCRLYRMSGAELVGLYTLREMATDLPDGPTTPNSGPDPIVQNIRHRLHEAERSIDPAERAKAAGLREDLRAYESANPRERDKSADGAALKNLAETFRALDLELTEAETLSHFLEVAAEIPRYLSPDIRVKRLRNLALSLSKLGYKPSLESLAHFLSEENDGTDDDQGPEFAGE